MRRIRSNLNGTGFAIVILAGVNLFVLLCICVLLTSYRAPRFGVNIRPAASDGLEGVKRLLDGWKNTPVRADMITVILACDEAVSIGTVQTLTDLIMQHGFTCAFYGRPATDE